MKKMILKSKIIKKFKIQFKKKSTWNELVAVRASRGKLWKKLITISVIYNYSFTMIIMCTERWAIYPISYKGHANVITDGSPRILNKRSFLTGNQKINFRLMLTIPLRKVFLGRRTQDGPVINGLTHYSQRLEFACYFASAPSLKNTSFKRVTF